MDTPNQRPPGRGEGSDYLQGGQIANSFSRQYFQPRLPKLNIPELTQQATYSRALLPNLYQPPPPLMEPPPLHLKIPNLYGQHLEGLYTERSYLVNFLQQESSKAAKLLRRIAQSEESLAQDASSPAQRKIKKQIGWIRHRFTETKRQETAIAARLRQLEIDINSAERWNQVQRERFQQEQFINTSINQLPQSMQRMQLNPTSPLFQPRESLSAPSSFSASTPTVQLRQTMRQYQFGASERQKSIESHQSRPSPVPEEDSDYDAEISPTTPNFLIPRILAAEVMSKPPAGPRPASFDNATLDILSTNNSRGSIEVAKRHSLPTIPGLSKIWEYTKEEEAEADAEEDVNPYKNPRSRVNSVF
ncbi:hypothetical protein G7Y89_g364 [Cudoniella acicularis]|uniref:Uncharacterized protein n=1 Tax=Cudoniella acicularis TaxID=354080 RepID=A0A8H4RXD9_9HELO|nr:hypothetical protein G7Y89_g364 [Cudoniella acicularis]